MIDARLFDARSHAEDGRVPIAIMRIGELGDDLADLLGNARAAFYRRAFADHRPYLDPTIHQTTIGPLIEGEQVARTAPILGRDQHADLARHIEEARTALKLTANAHDQPGTPRHDLAAVYAEWHQSHTKRLQSHMRTSLNDAQVALHHVIGRILVKPELRT